MKTMRRDKGFLVMSVGQARYRWGGGRPMTEDASRALNDDHGTAKSLSDRLLFVPGDTGTLRLENLLSDPDGETLFLPLGKGLWALFQPAS